MKCNYCVCCTVPDRYNAKVFTAQNINRQLSIWLSKFKAVKINDSRKYAHVFAFDNARINQVCNICPHTIDTSNIDYVEKEMNDKLSLLLCLTEKGYDMEVIFAQTLRLLRGNYPGKYRMLERLYYIQKKKNKLDEIECVAKRQGSTGSRHDVKE